MTVIVYIWDGKFEKYEGIDAIQESGGAGQIRLFQLIRDKKVVNNPVTTQVRLEVI